MNNVWLNGQLVAKHEMGISPYDHGILYGDGVFEGIRFYNNKPFEIGAHLERLARSAKAIRLNLPYSASELAFAVKKLIDNSAFSQGYLRLVVTRGVGPLGLNPFSCKIANCFILIDQLNIVEEQSKQRGVRAIISSTRRMPSDCLDARIKSLNYLNLILAKIEAIDSGADEAILLNTNGKVAEGSADNIFITVAGKLLTPPITDGALDGVTRQVIIQLARNNRLEVFESSLTPYDLYNAEECFLCGTGAELLPVMSIDGRVLDHCPGPIYQQINALFFEFVNAQTA